MGYCLPTEEKLEMRPRCTGQFRYDRGKLSSSTYNISSLCQVQVSRFLLHSYIGAAYCQRGLVPIQNWIDRLVLPDEIPEPPSTPPRQTSWGYPPRSSLSQSPQNTSLSSMTPLAVFNQAVQQNGWSIEWPAESTGPAHNLLWTVKCVGTF